MTDEARTLLGWRVPDHMQVRETPKGGYDLTCRHLVHVGGFPGRILSPHDEDLPTLVGHWFRDHSHGQALADAGLLADPEHLDAIAHAVRLLREAGVNRGDGLPARVASLISERDALQARNAAAFALHTEFKIYDECDHKHTDEDVEAGRAIDVSDLGYTCDDGFMYSVCRGCCCDGSEWQSNTCADNHEHPCWPCPTRVALLGDQPTGEAS